MGWGFLRDITRPFEDAAHSVGLSAGGATRPDNIFRETKNIYRQSQVFASRASYIGMKKLTGSEKNAAGFSRMFSVSTSALGGDPLPFKPVSAEESGSSNPTLFREGRQAGDWLGTIIGTFIVGGAVAGGGASAGEGGSGSAALIEAPTVGEQSTGILALQAPAEGSTSALTGMELETAAGTAMDTAVYTPANTGTPWLTKALEAAGTGAATATVTKLITKAVDTVINPLFASGSPAGGGGGGGGGSAGGYPFQEPSIVPVNTTQLYLVAAALAALLVVAMKKKKG